MVQISSLTLSQVQSRAAIGLSHSFIHHAEYFGVSAGDSPVDIGGLNVHAGDECIVELAAIFIEIISA